MKFSCESNALNERIAIVARALSVRTTQPILEGIRLEAHDEGRLILTGSDGTLTITCTMPADVEESGEAVLPGRLFQDVVRKMPAGTVRASMNERRMVTFRSAGSRTTLSGRDPVEYPSLPVLDEHAGEIILPQQIVKDMILRTSFAVSMDESRMVLTGGYLEVDHGTVNVVALDGFRMALRTARISDDLASFHAIIPVKALDEIARLMADDDEKTLAIRIDDHQLEATIDGVRLFACLIQGQYIDYRKVLPKNWTTTITVERDALFACVERAALMARDGRSNLIKFTVEGDQLIVTSNSELGDVYDVMDITNETGGNIAIAFNVKYIMEVARVLETGQVRLKFNTNVSPCLLSPAEGDAYTYLVLPVRTVS